MHLPTTLTDYLAVWGAAISTLLALVKLWELWQGRFKVDVSLLATSSEEIGNTVLVRNLSPTPFILMYWELHYCKGRWPFRKRQLLECADYDHGDVTVAPYSTHSLLFSGATYFSTSPAALKGRNISMTLSIAGKGTRTYCLYESGA